VSSYKIIDGGSGMIGIAIAPAEFPA
jgi:hypothetical protein